MSMNVTVLSNVQGFSKALDKLVHAAPDDIREVAASQIELLTSYHGLVLTQARKSFWAALSMAVSGFICFFAAAMISIALNGSQSAFIFGLGGTIVEVIAALNFYLYIRASTQLRLFHLRLELTQRFLLATALVEGLSGEKKEEALLHLIEHLVKS